MEDNCTLNKLKLNFLLLSEAFGFLIVKLCKLPLAVTIAVFGFLKLQCIIAEQEDK